MSLTRDGQLAFIALGPSNRIAVVDVPTLTVKKYLLVGQRVWQLALNADETRLYSTNGVSNDVSVIDVKKLKVLKSIAVGRYPWGIAIRD
jgi:YVTN family beta-propeller protein